MAVTIFIKGFLQKHQVFISWYKSDGSKTLIQLVSVNITVVVDIFGLKYFANN